MPVGSKEIGYLNKTVQESSRTTQHKMSKTTVFRTNLSDLGH